MSVNQILSQEIKDSELWPSREKKESTYKRDLEKRIEFINWVLENMNNPNIEICSLIESRMNETIQEINKTDSIFESDKLDILSSLCEPTTPIKKNLGKSCSYNHYKE